MKLSEVYALIIFIIAVIITPNFVFAYVDGGTIGQIFQYGYLLVYAALGGLLFVLRWLKNITKKVAPFEQKNRNIKAKKNGD